MTLSFTSDSPTQRLSPVAIILCSITTVASLLLCSLLMPLRLPGIDLLGTGTNWLLMWVVAWSIGRSPLDAVLGGLAAGAIHDGLTDFNPSHIWSLALVAYLTSKLHGKRSQSVNFAVISLTAFGLTIVAETVTALQFILLGDRHLDDLWTQHQRLALASAILNSLWSPVLILPLRQLWRVAAQWGQPRPLSSPDTNRV